MAENPTCLFSSESEGVICDTQCPQFGKATDRMGMNKWRRGINAIELSLKSGRRVNPGDLPDPVSGIEFATFSGARLEQCLYYQQQMAKIMQKSK
jgi:hypothetical protein